MVLARGERATYADVEAAPPDRIAELIDGVVTLMPRRAGPHVGAASDLGGLLLGPFRFGRGGPGGWVIYFEPELRFGDDVLVPDLAGWRAERLGDAPTTRFAHVAPDWVCEVLSPSTHRHDRVRKMPVYARAGVSFAWLVDPLERTIEAYRLDGGLWLRVGAWADDEVAPIPPFEAVPLELRWLWPSTPNTPTEGG